MLVNNLLIAYLNDNHITETKFSVHVVHEIKYLEHQDHFFFFQENKNSGDDDNPLISLLLTARFGTNTLKLHLVTYDVYYDFTFSRFLIEEAEFKENYRFLEQATSMTR